jgi:predicted DNA-binding transcriptional regulator AlpA
MGTPKSARARGRQPEGLGFSDAEGRPECPSLEQASHAVEPPMLLTREEFARELRCSVRELDRLRARGLLPAPIRLGRSPRWRREDVLAWLREVRS